MQKHSTLEDYNSASDCLQKGRKTNEQEITSKLHTILLHTFIRRRAQLAQKLAPLDPASIPTDAR
jgi:hypothetical protein